MATRTRAPLDQGLLNGLGDTLFKQLADGRWACFYSAGGKKGRILPSEATGRLFRRVSGIASLLAVFVTLIGTMSVTDRWIPGHLATNISMLLAVLVAISASLVIPPMLWVRRRYRRLPITEETLSAEETHYQKRAVLLSVPLALAAVALYGAGVLYAANNYELNHDTVPLAAIGVLSLGMSGTRFHRIIRAARRRASNTPETT